MVQRSCVEGKLRRIARPIASDLPPSADRHNYDVTPPVVSTHTVGKILNVTTFCGVTIRCKIMSVRSSKEGNIYMVKPEGDPKVSEFQRAGCPVTQTTAFDQFVAFEWQILSK